MLLDCVESAEHCLHSASTYLNVVITLSSVTGPFFRLVPVTWTSVILGSGITFLSQGSSRFVRAQSPRDMYSGENKRLVRERGLLEKSLHICLYFGEEHEPVFEARGPKFIRGMRIGRCRGLPSEKMWVERLRQDAVEHLMKPING